MVFCYLSIYRFLAGLFRDNKPSPDDISKKRVVMSSYTNNISNDEFIAFLKKQGYSDIRQLPDNEWVATLKLLFTTAVCTGMDTTTPFRYRWCFKNPDHAKAFFHEITEFDEVPKNTESLVGHRQSNGVPLLMLQDENGINRW